MNKDAFEAEAERLRKRVARERRARIEAEMLAEQGTRELFEEHQRLRLFNLVADAANGAKSVDGALQGVLDGVCEYTDWR